jgi:hypothetical protein
MSKAFNKGDKVTHIASWDDKGTVTYRNALVHSCGMKQMILTDEATGEEIGRHFAPVLGSLEESVRRCGVTFPRMTEEEAIAACLKVGALWVEAERERIAACRAYYANERASYHAALDEDEAKLHEPRALRYPSKP